MGVMGLFVIVLKRAPATEVSLPKPGRHSLSDYWAIAQAGEDVGDDTQPASAMEERRPWFHAIRAMKR